MKKLVLFFFGLLVLSMVGCATGHQAGYGLKAPIPLEQMDNLTRLTAFVKEAIKRDLLDPQGPDVTALKQSVQLYTLHSSWERSVGNSIFQKHRAAYLAMPDTELMAEFREFKKYLPQIKQTYAQLAQEAMRPTQLFQARQDAQVAQSNQAAKSSTQIQIPNFQVPNVQVPTPSLNMNPLGNPTSTGYMINTDQGLKHGNCTTTSSGVVYCP
jgi:hypothetical protein